jgi:hypothetical protein
MNAAPYFGGIRARSELHSHLSRCPWTWTCGLFLFFIRFQCETPSTAIQRFNATALLQKNTNHNLLSYSSPNRIAVLVISTRSGQRVGSGHSGGCQHRTPTPTPIVTRYGEPSEGLVLGLLLPAAAPSFSGLLLIGILILDRSEPVLVLFRGLVAGSRLVHFLAVH